MSTQLRNKEPSLDAHSLFTHLLTTSIDNFLGAYHRYAGRSLHSIDHSKVPSLTHLFYPLK